MANEYQSVESGMKFLPTPLRDRSATNRIAAAYKAVFYFARLKPRLLFVVGACLRALQQTTVLQLVFDPSVGVGVRGRASKLCTTPRPTVAPLSPRASHAQQAGLNILALMTSSRWPSPLLLGWATSKPFWVLLRAAPPSRTSIPISIHL